MCKYYTKYANVFIFIRAGLSGYSDYISIVLIHYYMLRYSNTLVWLANLF